MFQKINKYHKDGVEKVIKLRPTKRQKRDTAIIWSKIRKKFNASEIQKVETESNLRRWKARNENS